MKKYLSVIKTSFMQNLVEREVTLIWSIQSALAIITIVSVWIAGDKLDVAGYDKSDFVTYYFLLFILEQFTGWYIFWDVRWDIMGGGITNYLLKPIDYAKYIFTKELGYRLIKVVAHTIVSILVFIFLSGSIRLNVDILTILMTIPAVLLSVLIMFQMQFAMACVSFIWTESQFIAHFEWVLSGFFGGRYFPLILFPASVYSIVKWNPFRFIVSLPAEILSRRISGIEYIYAIGIGLFWVFLFNVVMKKAWKLGLKKYSAFGS